VISKEEIKSLIELLLLFWSMPDDDNGGDNFYTGLSPLEPCVSNGFVFTSDQVCSQGSLAIRSMVWVYFSYGFGVYSHLFVVFPSVQWFPKLYTDVLILRNIDTA